MRLGLLLRWSMRDLRRRWLQVAAIALVIAIGTGVYAALGSTATWRRESNDASFEHLQMYDLRVRAAEGADAPSGSMVGVAEAAVGDVLGSVEERLVVPTQVDASSGRDTILVPGRIVGMDVTDGGPSVNDVHVTGGRDLVPGDGGRPVALLEENFAAFYDLPPTGRLGLAGGTRVRYVGTGLAPEYFLVLSDDGGFFAQANLAVVFLPLESAQIATGRIDRVNDLVLRLRPGADVARTAAALERAFAASDLGIGATVMTRDDEDAYRILYDDIDGDRAFWNIFAGLILAGATFGAFNLVQRLVEAQRREIGIGMALGAPPLRLALRPLLVGAEIAIAGAVLGIVVGYLAVLALRPAYTSLLPLPIWRTELQPRPFLAGAALGVALPLLATAWPVWRAVRVVPIDAISTTHRQARSGLARVLRHLRWPVSAFRRMPLGNVLRTPRRAVLTALGIGATIATLVAILGMLDSFFTTMDRNEREVLQMHPDRVVVGLDAFVGDTGPEVAAVEAAPGVGQIDRLARVGGRVIGTGARQIDVLLEGVDRAARVWRPTLLAGDRSGVLLSEKAAADLAVRPGGMVVVEHPVLRGTEVVVERTPMEVSGIHAGPFRFNVYLDRATLGASSVTNELFVVPAAGHTADDVERALFPLDAVASVVPVAAASEIVRDSIDEFTAVFRVLEAFILFLAMLIAYNATSINADERAKERATLFALGLPVRRIVWLEMGEGMLIGLAGTATGLGVGALVLRWVVDNIATSTMPDLHLEATLSGGTVLTALVLGVVAVGIAPLLSIRRLRRMDIPGTLRVVE